MQIALLSCMLSIILLANAEATRETAILATESIAKQSKTIDPVQPVITSPPRLPNVELKERADGDYSDLIGYFSVSGYWYSMTCESGQYFAGIGTNGACCNSGEATCSPATACSGNEILGPNGGKASCGGELSICDTLTLFQTSGNPASGVWSIIECFGSSGFYEFPRTLYRNQFALTTSQTASTVTNTATATATVTVTEGPGASLRGRELDGLWSCFVSLAVGLFGTFLL